MSVEPVKEIKSEGHAERVALTPEGRKARNRRSLVIALTLGGLVLLFYAVTIVRLGANVANRTPVG